MSAGWAGSDRRQRLPVNWDALKAEGRRRNPAQVCHWCGEPGGDEFDHKVRGDDHSQENLDWIHGPRYVQARAAEGVAVPNCHGEKTALEAAAARAARPKRNRPPEVHPALR
jgi:5-methylcytosine-specific restriction enzyme A